MIFSPSAVPKTTTQRSTQVQLRQSAAISDSELGQSRTTRSGQLVDPPPIVYASTKKMTGTKTAATNQPATHRLSLIVPNAGR
jgi:hypothetical protein